MSLSFLCYTFVKLKDTYLFHSFINNKSSFKSGTGHIKFWKMAQTFTGLKLQGELGRFGKTEISDILGVFSMPDEKVYKHKKNI